MSTSGYPVHVEATLDTGLSRWLWLVKWIMLVPHYVVLALLWVAFLVLSVVAFVAILATGRYPRAIFDFNVGVLRWTWRVSYYAYGALATDRYPPFTLAETDYPAHLTVDYPEHLSRGLVLVKWWLLAIPHYLVVAVLAGSGVYFSASLFVGGTPDDRAPVMWGGGLIGLLAVVAAVVLLVTGRYPRDVFDVLLGLNRWVLRVAAYAALMTDEYPPFRLDLGGHEVAASTAVPAGGPAPGPAQAGPGSAPAAPAPVRPGGQEWGAGRVTAVVAGAVVLVLGTGMLVGGLTAAVADQTLRDDRGILMSPTRTVSTGTYAVVSERLLVDTGSAADWVPETFIGDLGIDVTGPTGQETFVGVARSADVAGYLAGVEHVRVADLYDDGTPVYEDAPGATAPATPTAEDIWVASVSGTGEQQLTWEVRDGSWTVVVMNADASRDVTADVSVGASVPVLPWVVGGLLVAGGVLLLGGIALVVAGLHGRRR